MEKGHGASEMGMALANSGIGRHHAKKGLARDDSYRPKFGGILSSVALGFAIIS